MSSRKSDQSVYAAGQAREFLNNALDGKENSLIYEYAGLIDDRDTLDLLNYYCGVFEDNGEDFLETTLARRIIQNAATQTADGAFRTGNVSQLQGMVGLTQQTSDDGEDAIVRMAKEATHEGFIGLVVGSPGSGKTAMTMDVAATWRAVTGGRVFTNVTSWKGADGYVTDSEALRRAMASTDSQVLAVIDEGSQSLTSRGAEASDSDAFAKDLKYVRKKEEGDDHAKRGSVIVIGHTENDTAKDIRRLATAMWVKPSRKDPGRVILKESVGSTDSFETVAKYKGLTDTAADYDEHEASHFEVVTDDADDDSQSVNVDQIRKEDQIKAVLTAILKGSSQPDAADYCDYSRGWVGERWREWKDGQHRDLVERPATLPKHLAAQEDEIV